MDEAAKRAIKKAILALRKLLEKEDIPAVLKQHGIFPDGRRIPAEKIALLDDAGKSRRGRLEAILEREIKLVGRTPSSDIKSQASSPDINKKAGVQSYCREVTFTYLNRIIALRCMEVRGLIDECIKTRTDYAGRSLRHHRFRRENPDDRFDAEDTDGLKAFLRSVFRELQGDIKILFDPDDEYSIIMPSLKALRECIRALIEDAPEDAFKQPELIGWVYQYFQTEEKDRVFEEVRTKKKKIQGDDIVPATSLYTERYMVDYLIQNSLGAIWMEMYPESKLCEKWPYFVKDQDLKPVGQTPRLPRPIKGITFLDPACGSGHFLLIAFDLYAQMYEEEWKMYGGVYSGGAGTGGAGTGGAGTGGAGTGGAGTGRAGASPANLGASPAICWPECKRYVEDYFTVMILRMLGFRWPKQIEANEPVPDWADEDGIIPISDHAGEKTLLERIRDRIGVEFGEDRIGAIEQEFSDILYNAARKVAEIKGKKRQRRASAPPKKTTLAKWLEREFFKRHTSQFKKRPIAWHLSSTNGTFQVLLFYHKLSGDILKNLKNRYLARVQSYYGVLLERARVRAAGGAPAPPPPF